MKSKVAAKFYWFIAISVCISVLVSSIAVAAYLLSQFEKEVLQKDELHLKGLSGNVKGFIDRSFSLNYQLSMNPIVINNLLEADKSWKQRISRYEKAYDTESGFSATSGLPFFVLMQEQYDFVELFFLQDIAGNQTARSFGKPGQRGKRWWFKQLMEDKYHRPFFSKSYYSLTGDKPVSTVFHPVYHQDTLVGVLGTDINFDFLQTFVSQHIFSQDLYAMITDNQGVIIAHPDQQKLKEIYNLKNMTQEILEDHAFDDSILDHSGHMKTNKVNLAWDIKISQVVKKAINGQSGFLKNVLLEGKLQTLYYQPVPVPGEGNRYFAAILIRDQSTLDNTKKKIVIFVVSYTIGSICLLLFLFHFFFKRFILTPLDTLTSSIKQADFSHSVPIKLDTDDEFQTLAETFNGMHNNLTLAGANLVELNEKLEEKVENRTTELRQINHELHKEIRDHRLTTKQLIKAKDQAESASRAKSQFLANISHELRTPMHGILSFVTLGLSKVDTLNRSKLKQFLQEIYSSGHRLLNLLNDLLDLSRLEAGKETYSFEEHRLSSLISKAIAEMSAFQKSRAIVVDFEEPHFDDSVVVDNNKIIQVLQNLISNAVKFSQTDDRIRIDLTQQAETLMVSVSDNGIGIPKDELEQVFDKFVQSSKTATGAGGTGLGLSICQTIIHDHQGSIWAENNPAGGSIFRLKIPRKT